MNEIAKDKLLHNHWGNVLMFIALLVMKIAGNVMGLFGENMDRYIVVLALMLVWIFAIGKELLDARDPKHHTAEVMDAVWTVYQPTIYTIFYEVATWID